MPVGVAQGIAEMHGLRALGMDAMETEELARRLAMMRVEHRDLDAAISALSDLALPDQIQLARLKKKKLMLRDEIAMLEDQMIPDISA